MAIDAGKGTPYEEEEVEQRVGLLDSESGLEEYGSIESSSESFFTIVRRLLGFRQLAGKLNERWMTSGFVDFTLMFTSEPPLVVGNNAGKRSVLAKRAKYYIPSLAWIPEYSWSLCVLFPRSRILSRELTFWSDWVATSWQD